MKHLFIINPAAGKYDHSAELSEKIRSSCTERGLDFIIQTSQKPGDCTAITREAAESGEQYRVYACGGDGTLNEVVNGAAGYPNAAVTNVPTGTGNDFLKLFGRDWRALFSNPEALARGPEAEFDLIDCGGMLGIEPFLLLPDP